MSTQTEVDKKWSDRMEREDIVTLNKFATPNSVVHRLGEEVMNLRKKNVAARPALWPPPPRMAAAASVVGYQVLRLNLCMLELS